MFWRKNQKILAFVLVFTMVFSFIMIPPKKAVAQAGLAGCLISGVASIINALAGTEVPVKDTGQSLKEQCIDALFYVLNEIVLKRITADTIKWINSGFDGNPAFVENPGKLLQEVADKEVSRYLEGSQLAFLCSPFQIEIKKAIIRQNSRDKHEKEITCSLSEVSKNVQNFLDGDFTDGGWDAWQKLSYDNPYNGYIKVSLEIEGKKLGALEGERDLLNWGSGFRSYRERDEKCIEANTPESGYNIETGEWEEYEVTEEEKKAIEANCAEEITTPGEVINQQLNAVLPSSLRRLEMADEINEIVDALFAHLINEALTKGLKNLSKKDSSGKSYTDDLGKHNSSGNNSNNGNGNTGSGSGDDGSEEGDDGSGDGEGSDGGEGPGPQ